MYIKRICYPVKTLGPGRRVAIWMTGCEKRCKGCMSPELQNMKNGNDYSIEEIMYMLEKIEDRIDGFTISGGEPFLQAKELYLLVNSICNSFTDDIIVYSGYSLKELMDTTDDNIEKSLSKIAVLIDGEYVDELNDGIGLRGSNNQNVHIFKYEDKYNNLETQPRSLQSFRYNNQILLVGIQ